MSDPELTYLYITVAGVLGLIQGLVNIVLLRKVPVGEPGMYGQQDSYAQMQNDPNYLRSLIDTREVEGKHGRVREVPYFENWEQVVNSLHFIAKSVSDGAQTFLFEEYKILVIFMLLFSAIIAVLVEDELGQLWTVGAFLLGACTSIASGYIGMRVATFSNSRTAYSAINKENGLANAFIVAFRGGSVLGFVLTSLGLLNLMLLIWGYNTFFLGDEYTHEDVVKMYECIAGYGLGGSSIALFARVGGGIYTKAADVGADLAGKVEAGLEEDDPRNPATIADNVGDNVGDIAGMGADLFGSFAESTCACLVVASTSAQLVSDQTALYFPLLITATGIFVSIVTSYFATNFMKVNEESKIEKTLKFQLFISTFLLTPAMWFVSQIALPETFYFERASDVLETHNWHAFVCVMCGLWSGLTIGLITEFYTSHSYFPVRQVAESCKTGAATNIIYGLALGYLSCIIPTLCLGITIYISLSLSGMYGISLAALGMLSNLCTALAIDGYGPISDNAGGMVEMIHLKHEIRQKTDALDAAGNTTAAIGKGFAIGSAALVSLALFGAFVTRSQMKSVDILNSLQFSGLLVGAMLPYAFSAMTMKSVGKAAYEMVQEVREQFEEMNRNPAYQPQYQNCIKISTQASLKEMILPGMMVMLTPVITGWLLGPEAVAGLLAGILVSGVQMATSSANSGGAWDNAKKFIEKEALVPKSSPEFKEIKAAAVTGDTVGDPMKDTSGPSLNILVKLSAIISLVFGGFFASESGGVLLKYLA